VTRKQVAQRLGKSVATVRRLEGVLLHPREDGHGRYHFDATEVEQLAERIEAGEIAPWQHLRAAGTSLEQGTAGDFVPDCLACQATEARVVELEAAMAAQREAYENSLAASEAEAKRQRSRYEAEHSSKLELEREFRRLVRFLESA
jgi:hypothetical protein